VATDYEGGLLLAQLRGKGGGMPIGGLGS